MDLFSQNLHNHTLIKLLSGERILLIQRRHWYVLVAPFIIHVCIILGLLLATVWIFYQQLYPILFLVSVYISLIVLAFLAVTGTYSLLDWYYHFYIVTNRRMTSIRFFRMGKYQSEEVFHDINAEREIDRKTRSLIHDFLNIEDVYVYFHRSERPEPFIFETPRNAVEVEELLEELSRQEGKR